MKRRGFLRAILGGFAAVANASLGSAMAAVSNFPTWNVRCRETYGATVMQSDAIVQVDVVDDTAGSMSEILREQIEARIREIHARPWPPGIDPARISEPDRRLLQCMDEVEGRQ